jgi:hypothetical protein
VEKGYYKGRRVDFSKFAASCFNPFLFAGSARSRLGCGASALALLTGTAPEAIIAKKRGTHYSDDFMMRFLRGKGFRVLLLTLCNLSSATANIGAAHVLLISQLFRKNEGTWGVIFNGLYYHNFESYLLETLCFINKPILSAYLVAHPRWQMNPLASLQPSPRPKIRSGGLTLAALGMASRGLRSDSSAQHFQPSKT